MLARKYSQLPCSRSQLDSAANRCQCKDTVVFIMPVALSSVCHAASGSAVLVAILPPLTSSTTLSELDTKKYSSIRPRLSEIRS